MGPGTTCWPGGVLKCSPGVGGSKMASRGVELLLTPPTPTYDAWVLRFQRLKFPANDSVKKSKASATHNRLLIRS